MTTKKDKVRKLLGALQLQMNWEESARVMLQDMSAMLPVDEVCVSAVAATEQRLKELTTAAIVDLENAHEQVMDEETLDAVLTFYSSPAGQKWLEDGRTLGDHFDSATAKLVDAIQDSLDIFLRSFEEARNLKKDQVHVSN